VEYRVEARCGESVELLSIFSRPGTARLTLEAPLRGPTQFLVSARWKVEGLDVRDWTEPVVSTLVAGKGFLPPATPIVVVTATDSSGLYGVAEWRVDGTPRAFQIRYLDGTWHLCPPVLSAETRARLPGELPLGGRYSVSVRVGDGVKWSEWSPPSQQFLYCVPPPLPVAGDRLQLDDSNGLVLRWQPFRTSSEELADLEYKISYVEAGPELKQQTDALSQQLYWSARLAATTSRAAWHGKPLTTLGFVRHSTQEDVVFNVGRLQGRQVFRFFICARYASLRSNSSSVVALLPEGRSAERPANATWPDEEIDLNAEDPHLLNKIGLWSATWQSPPEE
jgi:hypothetical protein